MPPRDPQTPKPKAARKQQNPSWAQSAPHASTVPGEFDENGNFVLTQSQPEHHHAKRQNNKNRKPRQNNRQHPTHRPNEQSDTEFMSEPTPSPAKQYYAGSNTNFCWSPAASALPLPKAARDKLMSKSLPNGSNQPTLQSMVDQDTENQSEDSSGASPSPTPAVPVQKQAAGGNALDFLFDIDREERKEKKVTEPVASVVPKSFTPPASHWANIYGNHARARSQDIPTPRTQSPAYPYPSPNLTPPVYPPYPSPGRNQGMRSVTDPSIQAGLAHQVPPQQQQQPPQNQYPPPEQYQTSPVHMMQQPRNHSPHHMNSYPQQPYHQQQTPPGRHHSPYDNHNSPGGTPPHPQGPPPNDAPYHYGNRNLSPLFKAVKADSARRPSNLRQQLETESPIEPPLETPTKSQATTSLSMPLGNNLTPATTHSDTKSIEDDLKKLLNLSRN